MDGFSPLDFESNNSEERGLFDDYEKWNYVNSFVARLFAARLAQLGSFAIFELRNGLEEDDKETKQIPVAEARIRTACEWITKGGLRLLQESLNNTFQDSPEGANQGTPYRPGVLFKGVKDFNLERWGFWKRRLTELWLDHESLKEAIDQALAAIERVEASIATKSLGLISHKCFLLFKSCKAWENICYRKLSPVNRQEIFPKIWFLSPNIGDLTTNQLQLLIAKFLNIQFVTKCSSLQLYELNKSNYFSYETVNQLPFRHIALTIQSHPTSLIGGINLYAVLDHVTSNC